MEEIKEKSKGFWERNQLVVALILFLLVFAGVGSYGYFLYTEEVSSLNGSLADARGKLGDYIFETKTLQKSLASVEGQKDQLATSLEEEKNRNDAFSEQIASAQEAVNTFQKLSSIDKEVLEKYSKVYFLSEHYVPSSLSILEKRYLYYEDDPEQIHSQVKPFLTNMLDTAAIAGVDLYVRSGYRSFGIQSDLKSKYVVTYGPGTSNAFSADQGYSEHQLGTAVDFLTTGIGGTLDGFGDTRAFEWLKNNAYKYGFILSYPEGNEYYIYEPWHWRFVGVALATELKRRDMNFYDMDQREIDTYLVSVFD